MRDTWNHVSLILWFVWALMFGILEGKGLQKEHDGWPPLTQVVRRYVPKWIALSGCAWLVYHFSVTYVFPAN